MPDEVVDTPFGKFLVDPAECIGSTVKAGTVWDGPGFLQVLAREVLTAHPCDAILDVGAHLGDWTVWLCHQGAVRVVACEPAPLMLQYLKANLDLNKAVCADRVILLPVAAYDRRAMLQWATAYDPANCGGMALVPLAQCEVEGHVDIPAAPLDDYADLFNGRVSLVKVDAQGCDFRALVGLERTLRRDHSLVVFEWEAELATAHGDTLANAIVWLNQREYAVREWPSHPHNYVARWDPSAGVRL